MTSLSLAIKEGKSRNWADLPPELTSSILYRLGVIEILKTAQKVCKSWHRICKDPSMWRKIDLSSDGISSYICNRICRQAVDRSQGGLVEIRIMGFVTESLLKYIVDRSSNLRSLGIATSFGMTSEGLVNAVGKLPLLEELEISPLWCKLDLKAIGQACPQLKTLKLKTYKLSGREDDDDALAIAASMPQLRILQLFGNGLTNFGLKAILESCPHLEHLDLRECFNINLGGIKDLRQPNDSKLIALLMS